MKIGIFDSGLGGLIVARAIRRKIPQYDYVYLGDTKRVPYGNRSHEAVLEFTREGVDYLFRKENCAVVVLACNTASARALEKLQKEYLPKNFPDRVLLGVLVPAAEEAAKYERVGVLGTQGTIASGVFLKEIKKKNKQAKVFQNSAPMLVPLAEGGEIKNALPFIQKYLKTFQNKKLDALVLGCTHYPIFKKEIQKIIETKIKIISQDEIMPENLKKYFTDHPELSNKLSLGHSPTGESRKGRTKILVTDKTQTVNELTKKWFGKVKPKLIVLSSLDNGLSP